MPPLYCLATGKSLIASEIRAACRHNTCNHSFLSCRMASSIDLSKSLSALRGSPSRQSLLLSRIARVQFN